MSESDLVVNKTSETPGAPFTNTYNAHVNYSNSNENQVSAMTLEMMRHNRLTTTDNLTKGK